MDLTLDRPAATRAAEGLPRRAFTVKDVERMVEVGLLHEDERIELIGGELVPISPKGTRHEIVKQRLVWAWSDRRPPDVRLIVETTLVLGTSALVDPDLLVIPSNLRIRDLSPDKVLLAVEVADTSLDYDLGRKPDVYAAHGVCELWVIDVERRQTHMHRDLADGRYTSVTIHDSSALLVARRAPELSLRLDDLDWED